MRNEIDQNFVKSIEEKILIWYSKERSTALRSNVMNNSNFNFDNLTFFNLKNIGLQDSMRLALISWFIDEEVAFLLREDLKQKSEYFNLEDRFVLEQFLSTKNETLVFLIETSLWHTRDFFGNFLGNLGHLDSFLKPMYLKKKIVEPKLKRGYHDHGSRVEDHRWLPKRDFSLNELHREIESKRVSLEDTLKFAKGLLT